MGILRDSNEAIKEVITIDDDDEEEVTITFSPFSHLHCQEEDDAPDCPICFDTVHIGDEVKQN